MAQPWFGCLLMKILHLVSSGGYYGKESVIINLCSALEKLGCGCEVGAFLHSHTPNDEVVVRAHRQNLAGRTFDCRGRLDLRTIRTIRDHIRAQQIDLVHTHDNKADLYGYLAAKWADRPVVATCHLWFTTNVPSRIYAELDRLVLKHFDGIIAVSPPIGDTLRRARVPEGKVTVIANGIGFSSFLEVEDESSKREFGSGITIGIVGRLTRQKGHTFLFAAARGILQKFPAASFVVVGEGPDRKPLEALAEELGIAENVYFAGYRDDMAGVYGALDLMVMPSLDEGLPMALLEAMAAKRAVIATSVGAVPDVIEHGVSGLLVKPSDAMELEGAVLSLLNDPSLRRRIGENARNSVVARFSSDLMAQNYLDFYKRTAPSAIIA